VKISKPWYVYTYKECQGCPAWTCRRHPVQTQWPPLRTTPPSCWHADTRNSTVPNPLLHTNATAVQKSLHIPLYVPTW
jgi:hypothetical protein